MLYKYDFFYIILFWFLLYVQFSLYFPLFDLSLASWVGLSEFISGILFNSFLSFGCTHFVWFVLLHYSSTYLYYTGTSYASFIFPCFLLLVWRVVFFAFSDQSLMIRYFTYSTVAHSCHAFRDNNSS